MHKYRIAHCFGIAALFLATPTAAEVLDNATVVDLISAGLGSEAVIAKIESSETAFDVSTSAIIALAQAGVSSDIIAAMIGSQDGQEQAAAGELSWDSPDPLVPHFPGVYLLSSHLDPPRMEVINATTSNQTRTGGFLGYALTGGLASMSFKTTIPNRNARLTAEGNRPTFYFYFDQSVSSLSRGASDSFWAQGSVTSPAEFSLVRFDVKRDRREAKVGSFSLLGGARQGVMSEDQIATEYTSVAPGVFEVRPAIDLEPGEYGFIYSAASGGGTGAAGVGAMTSRIFDFSIAGAIED